jgi:branched-chain amino acid transport system substrate-binding protein
MGLIIGQSLEKAATRDPKKIRDAMATTEFTNLPFPATKVKFGDNGLNVHNQSIMTEWLKGELRTVWPKPVQATQPVL